MNEGTSGRYEFYNDYGCGYFLRFVKANPEFSGDEFFEWVVQRNRGDRDDGEVQDIAPHEVLRLAADFAEYRWRFRYPLIGAAS